MNYDINTPQGMANCVRWTRNVMESIKNGGAWVIPRSGTSVVITDHASRKCRVVEGFAPDMSIKIVLRASGWLIEGEKNAE